MKALCAALMVTTFFAGAWAGRVRAEGTTITPAPWHNVASAPSMSRDRGYLATHKLLKSLKIPKCAVASLASRIVYKRDYQNAWVSNKEIFTPTHSFNTVLDMTFRKDEVDYVQRIKVDVYEPFIAEVYNWSCGEQSGHVAFFPKCQNLGVLGDSVRHNGRGGYGGGWGGFHDHKHGHRSANVPGPAAIWLILLGIIPLLFKRRT